MSKIHNMKLHKELRIDENTWVMRVPGGWIYTCTMYATSDEASIVMSTTFVPFDEEFLMG